MLQPRPKLPSPNQVLGESNKLPSPSDILGKTDNQEELKKKEPLESNVEETPLESNIQPTSTQPSLVTEKPIKQSELATSGGVIDDKVVPKVIYVNKDPKYGPVESIPKDIPYGTAYEVVKNSVQLKKWREQNIQEPNILEREGKKAIKGVNKFLDVLTNIVTLGTQEESPISIPGGDENAYQLARKVNNFRTNLPDYSKTADEEYQEAKSGGDWWQKTKEVGASALNFMADVITQSVRGDEKAPKMEVDSPLKKYEDDVLKNAAENNETLSQEEIDKRTEFAFKQDRISNLRQSDLNSFNYNLSPNEQKILQNYTSEQTSHLKDEQKKILSSINIASAIADKSVSDFDKEIKRQNAIISSGGQVTPEDKNRLSILEKKANDDTQQLQYSQKKYFENTNDLGTFEQERDIFSKEGNRIIDSLERLNVSIESLAGGGLDYASYLAYVASLPETGLVRSYLTHATSLPLSQKNMATLSSDLHNIAVGINRDVENTEKFLVETTNANTPEDYLNKILNFTFESAPMVALGATGIGGVVAMGATSAGQKFGEEYDSKDEVWKKVVAPVLYGGAMMIPVAQGLKIVKHGKRVVSAIEPQLMKKTVSQYAKNAVKKVSKFGGESFDTAVAFKAQGVIQIVGVNHLILGKEIDYNELFDMKLYESAGFTLLNKAVPLVMGMATKPFFSEKEYKIIDANSKKILELTKELDKATKEQKAITQDVINTLSKNSRDLIKSKLKQIESMPEPLQKKVIDTYVEQSKLRQEALVVKASRMSIENKKTALEVKQEEYREVSKLRNDINSGTYLEIDLPENKLKYESLAVKELIKENEGKSFDFKPEDVRKKAIELLDKDNKENAQAKLDEIQGKSKKIGIPELDIKIEKGGVFSGEFLNDYDFLAEGSEHTVYKSKDGKTVIKIGEPYNSNETYQARVDDAMSINKLLGDSSLEVIGTYKSPNGTINPVYKQNFIEGKTATQEQVVEHLTKKGFTQTGKDTFTINKDGKTLEISDTSDNFIIDVNGKIVAIDAAIKALETPKAEVATPIAETTKGVDEVKDTKDTGKVQEGVEKVEPVLSKTDEAFRDKIRDIPNSGLVGKYLSGETIERVEGEVPRNKQDIEILNLVEAGNHGKETIEMAKEKYGDKYVEKTLEFLESTNLKSHEKAIVYISLENELFDAVKAEPDNLGLKKLQDLVREKSQALGREGSLTINAGRLRAIMKDGFDVSKVTNQFLSDAELRDKSNVEKAIQSNAEKIQKEYENALSESDIENLIAEGVAEKINEIYKNLPSQRKIKADKAVKALENIQKKLRGKAYDATIGIPVAILDSGITIIKNSIKAGVSIADAIEIGIKHIKEKYGKDWDKENEFRTDMFDGFKSEGIKEREIKSKELSNKEVVNNALIQAGFGKEITVKTKEGKVKKTVLDWRKLAGEEGSIDKIKKNVEKIIGEEDAKDLEAEYNNLRARIIEKSLNELENRNTPRSPVSIKTSAKKLAELYNYGLFEKEADTYDNILNTALGMSKLNQENFIEAKKLAGKLSELFSQKDNEGNQISQENLKHAERVINRQIENLLSKTAWSDSNGVYKATIVAKEYIGLAQRNALVSAGQAVENTTSGYISRIFKKIGFAFDDVDTKSLKQSRNALARMTFKDITLNGGLEFGDVTSPFITKSKTQDLIVNASDSQVYHALASAALGKPFLESADSMHKSALAQGYFHYNLIKILRKKGYSKDEAKNYVSEKLTGQSFEDALVTSKQIIDKINEGSDKKIIPDTKESIYRFANDLVNEALIQGNKITLKELEASLKSAETVAGFELGHEPNNVFSKPLNLLNSWVQVKVDRAVKQKEWNNAAALTSASIISQNVLNPYVGGGTNWMFLAAQKTGIPTASTFYWNIRARGSKLDLSSESGIKNLEQTLKYQLLAKNANIRMFVGATVSLSAFALFKSTGADDDLYQWLKKNEWANKYFKKIAPPALQFMIAQKNKELGNFLANQMNIKIDAFDEGKKIKRAIDNAASGKTKKALGGIGQLVGSRLNTPIIPWRVVKDARDVYRGLNGLEPVKSDYKTSGFWNGYFQGGMVEQLGLRPEKDKVKITPKTQEEMEKSMREAMKKVSEQMKKERRQ